MSVMYIRNIFQIQARMEEDLLGCKSQGQKKLHTEKLQQQAAEETFPCDRPGPKTRLSNTAKY